MSSDLRLFQFLRAQLKIQISSVCTWVLWMFWMHNNFPICYLE